MIPEDESLSNSPNRKANKAVAEVQKELPDTKTNTVEPLVVDLDSDESIEKAKDLVESKYGRVDALINNAGATSDIDYLNGKLSLRESFTRSYDTNVVSPNSPQS